MPIPLVWIGAGIAATYAGLKLSEQAQKSAGVVGHFPGESSRILEPQNGAVVTCGVYGIFDHSGIWVDGEIIELNGNGLIRVISPERFIEDRSGAKIYVAADKYDQVLGSTDAAQRACDNVYQYRDYDLIKQNCHRFSWECTSGGSEKVTRFSELNEKMSDFFVSPIHWHPIHF